MHVDLFSEERLSLNQLAKETGKNPSTVWRWYLTGVRGGIRLETYVEGGRRYTTRPAYRRFQERCTAVSSGGQSAPELRSPRQREADIDRAERELAEMGI